MSNASMRALATEILGTSIMKFSKAFLTTVSTAFILICTIALSADVWLRGEQNRSKVHADLASINSVALTLQNFRGRTNDRASDPTLELHDANGAVIAFDDNWKDSQQNDIMQTRLAPTNDAESAIFLNAAPGNYTAIVRGKNDTTGTALVEIYNTGE
jgi:hypothetical protein